MKKREHLHYRELEMLLAEASETVPVGSVWRHFKGGDFKVIAVVFDAETLQLEIVHEPLDHEGVIFTRTMTNWLESVNFEGYTLPRFEHMED